MSGSDSSDDSERELIANLSSRPRRTLRSSNRSEVERAEPRRASRIRSYRQESSDEDEQPSSPKKTKNTEISYTPEAAAEESSSDSESSGTSEEDAALQPKKRRTSNRLTPQKRQAQRSQRTALDSSDEDDDALTKRPRISPRSEAGASFGNRGSALRSPQKAGGSASVNLNGTSTQKTMKSSSEAAQVIPTEEESPEDEPAPRSPKKVAFLTTPSTSATNGAARTTPKKGDSSMEENSIPALILCIRTNTAMMGDLAAEVRLLRDAIAEQNRKR